MSAYKIILSGGGTGGHIYPAIAIANELKSRHPKAELLFVGAKDRMEMDMVPKAGYNIIGLWISGIQRKLTIKNLMFPFKLISSLWKARKIIRNFYRHRKTLGAIYLASRLVKKIPSIILGVDYAISWICFHPLNMAASGEVLDGDTSRAPNKTSV